MSLDACAYVRTHTRAGVAREGFWGLSPLFTGLNVILLRKSHSGATAPLISGSQNARISRPERYGIRMVRNPHIHDSPEPCNISSNLNRLDWYRYNCHIFSLFLPLVNILCFD